MATSAASSPSDDSTLQILADTASNILKHEHLEEAWKTCQTLVETHPDQPSIWLLYGLTAMVTGVMPAAIQALERAVALHRSNPSFHRLLGRAYRAAGRQDEAAAELKHALWLEPGHAESTISLGLIHIAQGQKDAGISMCCRGIAMHVKNKLRTTVRSLACLPVPFIGAVRAAISRSDHKESWVAMTRGSIRHWLGDDTGAIEQFRLAASLAPENEGIQARVGHFLIEQNRFQEALPCLEKVTHDSDSNLPLLTEYGIALMNNSRSSEAIEVLESVLAKNAESVQALIALGRAKLNKGDIQSAQKILKRAVSLAPNSARARVVLGRSLQENGAIEAANRWFQDALTLDPHHADAFLFLASNKQISPHSDHFLRVLARLNDCKGSNEERLRLHFAVGKVFEEAGDYESAMAHYDAGNNLKNVIFDPDQFAAFVDQMIYTFDHQHFARTRPWGNQDDRPVFIVGMMRSGTSLAEQILASHHSVFGGGELEDFGDIANDLAARSEKTYFEAVAELDTETLPGIADAQCKRMAARAPDALRITDKMPENFLHIGLILTLFPNARIIHCRRDPRDTCFSIYSLDFGAEHSYAYNLTNLGRYYRQYERLMDHWREVAPDSILDVQYEDLIADQEGQTRRILDFCGLDWDDNCLAFHKTDRLVHTWSYRQVRQPIYKSSVARWRRFKNHLAPLIAELDVQNGAN